MNAVEAREVRIWSAAPDLRRGPPGRRMGLGVPEKLRGAVFCLCLSVHVMDRPWEAFDRARRVLRGRDYLAGGKSADLPSVHSALLGGILYSAPALSIVHSYDSCFGLSYLLGELFSAPASCIGTCPLSPGCG